MSDAQPRSEAASKPAPAPAAQPRRDSPWELAIGPPPEHWDDWVEYDSRAWPRKLERHYRIVPTICFNCESACGLLAFVDKQSGQVEKFEGNPVHPGSRGRTCAKGPATINQIQDQERILKPLKRSGPRGSGRFEEVTWEAVLSDLGARIRAAILAERRHGVMYHVGRPGEDHFLQRLLQAWGFDGYNSHTNVCSASARTGMALWCGADRPSPDYAETRFMLLLSAHLETGHYFNPHAQRIVEAKERGVKMAVIDARLSNTASRADHWIATWPGSEAALLLGVARELLESGRIDREFVGTWVNWQASLEALAPGEPRTLEAFIGLLKRRYARYTPEYVAAECRVDAGVVKLLADEIAAAGSRFSSHLWRNAASGNLGGWQVQRALILLHVLSGSLGTPGGVNLNGWDKQKTGPKDNPPALGQWNELIWPREWPLSHYEMSFLLPYLLEDQGKSLDVYFTRVYNPVWTNPDGGAWIAMFEHPERIGCHVALTPIWSETAQWADYVLPMGLASERHDVMSQETHAGTWIGFRQPVGREFKRLEGQDPGQTLGSNPGEVWEEAEFWVALTHRIDPDGSLGIRRWYESKARPGQPISMDEYFGGLFENVPGLPEAARAAGQTPLEFMRRRGAFEVPYGGQERYAEPVAPAEAARGAGLALPDGRRVKGFATPSKKLEWFSPTLAEWGFPGSATPEYEQSHVHWSRIDFTQGERCLLPTFRLPTLIHTRSGNAKWLQEISHTNPLWIHPEDARLLGIQNGALAKVATEIGHFVLRAWETDGIRPGVVACSHHVGRWRLFREIGGQQQASALVELRREGELLTMRQKQGAGPYASFDPDSERVWWKEVGVNQNLTFPVQPDPVSGMHCWHQKVRVTPAGPDDRYGDIQVDLAKSRAVYERWRALAKPAPGPGGLRRPLWLNRPLHPTEAAYRL
jgi:anaerobic selenocysteine-containing dehydrogenase